MQAHETLIGRCLSRETKWTRLIHTVAVLPAESLALQQGHGLMPIELAIRRGLSFASVWRHTSSSSLVAEEPCVVALDAESRTISLLEVFPAHLLEL